MVDMEGIELEDDFEIEKIESIDYDILEMDIVNKVDITRDIATVVQLHFSNKSYVDFSSSGNYCSYRGYYLGVPYNCSQHLLQLDSNLNTQASEDKPVLSVL